MSVDEARSLLISLTGEQEADLNFLDEESKQLEQLLKVRDMRERMVQQRRNDIAEAKRELARQETLASAKEKSENVDEGVERLRARFEKRAENHIWYKGTGNNDAILPHQWQAICFGTVAERWVLGDGMGLGKTRTAIGWLDIVQARKVIIVCQADICDQFAGEVMELSPHREMFNLYKKQPTKRHEMLDSAVSKDDAVIVVNFEIWRRDKDVLAKLLGWQADTIIVDEAHNLKTTSTKTFQDVKTLVLVDNTCGRCKGHIKGLYEPKALRETPSRKVPMPCGSCGWTIGQPTRVRSANKLEQQLATKSVKNLCFTTGTPILNDPVDLYSLLHLCDPVLFPTKAGYQKTYLSNNHHNGKWEFRTGALENLKPLIEGMFISRQIEDAGITLPPQHVHVIPVDLDKNVYKKQYRAIRQISEAAQIVLDSGEEMTIMHLIALITRKRQANVWPGGIQMKDAFGNVIFDAGTEIDESVKMDAIMENIIKIHREGRRQVVFSQFKTGLAEFERRIAAAGIRAVRMDGDTPKPLRDRIRTNFYAAKGEKSEWDIVLANYKTGGTGLNLTAATVTHILDEEWNPGKRDQGYARTHRMGQANETDVFVYRIPGTIDTWMSNTIKRKEEMIQGFENTMTESTATEELENDFRRGLLDGSIL